MANRHFPEPWELGEWEEILDLSNEDPESVFGNVSDLNCRSAISTLHGFHLDAP
jgi:hypothetical protein